MTRASDLAKLLGAGATINDGTTITTADNTSQLILQSTDADATRGPTLTMQRDSSSPADNDIAGQIFFNADNDAAEDTTYADVFVKLTDVSNGTEDASMSFRQISNGSLKEVVMVNGNIDFGDGSGIRLGDGQDFQLYHDGTDNHINVTNAQTLNIQTSGNNAIVVDANGVVTTPKIPMMLAQGGRTVTSTGTTDFWYLALPERYDTTNSYNASTGIFTAPVAGKYFVYSHLKMSSSQSNAHYSVSVNSAYQGGGGGYDANNAWQIQTGDYMQWTGMVNVSANDTIRMVLYPDGVKNALDTNTNRNHFVVYLVG